MAVTSKLWRLQLWTLVLASDGHFGTSSWDNLPPDINILVAARRYTTQLPLLGGVSYRSLLMFANLTLVVPFIWNLKGECDGSFRRCCLSVNIQRRSSFQFISHFVAR
jgi:hypothetical protein